MPHDVVRLWEQLTLRAHGLYEHGLCERAVPLYEEARAMVLSAFHRWPAMDDALATLTVSHLNLSEALRGCGRVEAAVRTVLSIHASLLGALADGRTPAALRAAAASQLPATLSALSRLDACHGPMPELRRWLSAGWPPAVPAPAGTAPSSTRSTPPAPAGPWRLH